MRTTILTAKDLARVVAHVGLDGLMDQMIQGLSDALLSYDEDALATPVRDGFDYTVPHSGLIEWMPAMELGESAIVKLVGYHPSNPHNFQLPTILSSALHFDTGTGRLLSLLDTTFLTALRTGAASAIASRLLAVADSRTLGLVGAGAQAVTQLHALSRTFELERVLVFDTDARALASFAQRAGHVELPGITLCQSALEELCEQSDIICTATSVATNSGPVLADRNLRPWLHVNAVGSDFPGKTELPLSLLQRSLVCPDYLPQAMREGECQQLPAAAVGPQLVDLLKNAATCKAHRNSTTVFDSTGWALEDYVAVKIFLQLAAELECGTELELADLSLDPMSPYAFTGGNDHSVAGTASQIPGQVATLAVPLDPDN